MSVPSIKASVDARASDEAERVALSYLQGARDDRWLALVRLASDALFDLQQAEAAIRERGHLASQGFVRAGLGR